MKGKKVAASAILAILSTACASTSTEYNEPLPARLTSAAKEKHVEITRHLLSDSLIENKLILEIYLNDPIASIKAPFRTVFSIYMDTLYQPEGANLLIAMCGESTACLHRSNSGSGNFSEKIWEVSTSLSNQTLVIPVPIEVLLDAWEYKNSLRREGTTPRNGILLWSNVEASKGSASLQTKSGKLVLPFGLQEPLLELTK